MMSHFRRYGNYQLIREIGKGGYGEYVKIIHIILHLQSVFGRRYNNQKAICNENVRQR